MAARPRYATLIARRRLELGLRQRDLAGRLGVTDARVCQMEAGQMRHLPSPERVAVLCDVLRLEPLDLLEAWGYRVVAP